MRNELRYIPVRRAPWKSALTSFVCIAAALGAASLIGELLKPDGVERARSSDI